MLYETNETFPKDIIQNFNHIGGQMYCCEDCAGHLDIPAGAIATGTNYKVIQQFPFINSQDETKCDYRIVCIKEFHERRNQAFKKHVQIVIHFMSDLDVQHVKVRFSTDKGTFGEIFQSDDSGNSCGQDVYFTVQNNILTIFATHFTIFR